MPPPAKQRSLEDEYYGSIYRPGEYGKDFNAQMSYDPMSSQAREEADPDALRASEQSQKMWDFLDALDAGNYPRGQDNPSTPEETNQKQELTNKLFEAAKSAGLDRETLLEYLTTQPPDPAPEPPPQQQQRGGGKAPSYGRIHRP